ncbi:MAG: hypothetical protein KC646_03905 [Candidatus Cloacimonetes bacterium]|nr:hypothetical protein [Candidatus Cloacimonadota bacterium]
MNKFLIYGFTFMFVSSLSTFAGTRHVVEFAPSVGAYFGFDMTRFVNVADKIHFGKPSYLARKGIISSDAEATYNDILNVIALKEDNFVQVSRFKARVKSLQELKRDSGHSFSIKIDTIMHEMAHAEMDKFIQEDKTPQDRKLNRVLVKEVKPWIKRNSKRSSSIGVYELHGYFVGQIIETMNADIGDIFMYNGVNSFNDKFFPARNMKKKAVEDSLEEFTNLYVPERNANKSYGERIKVGYIWVKGKELELKGPENDPFKDEWYQALWDHFAHFYKPPTNITELTQHLNENHYLMKKLVEYRTQLHEELNAFDEQENQTEPFADLNQE